MITATLLSTIIMINDLENQVDFMPRAMAALWKMSKSPFTGTGDRSSQKEQLWCSVSPLKHFSMIFFVLVTSGWCRFWFPTWVASLGWLSIRSTIYNYLHVVNLEPGHLVFLYFSFALWAWGWRRWWPRKSNSQIRTSGDPGRQTSPQQHSYNNHQMTWEAIYLSQKRF